MVSSIKVVSFLDLPPELRLNIYQYTAPKNEIVKYIAWARQMSIGLRPDSTIEFSATGTLRNRIMPHRIFRSLCKTTRNEISHEHSSLIWFWTCLTGTISPLSNIPKNGSFHLMTPLSGSMSTTSLSSSGAKIRMKTYRWIAKVATFIERLDAHLGVRGHAINTLTSKVEENSCTNTRTTIGPTSLC